MRRDRTARRRDRGRADRERQFDPQRPARRGADTPRNPATIHSLDELGREPLDEIEHFFVTYNEAEGRTFKPIGRCGPEEAKNLVTASLLASPQATRKARRRS